MTVRDELANMTTSSTGREAADGSLAIAGDGSPKGAKISPWVCCEGAEVTVVASTDIPAHVTARPYPGGLDFGARTSDHQAVDQVVEVSFHCFTGGGFASVTHSVSSRLRSLPARL